MMLCACGGSKKASPEEEVRIYGKYFIEKVSAPQLDSLQASYPDIVNADSIVPIQSDTIIVTESAPDQYNMTIAEGVILKLNHFDDGHFTVTESNGLFAFPKDKLDLAKKTGMWEDKLSDSELAKRINDEGFTDYLKKIKTVKTSDIFSISKMKIPKEIYGITDTTQPITNLTDQEISGNDYSVILEYYFQMAATDEDDGVEKGTTILKGKNIRPGGTVEFPVEYGFRGSSEIKSIKWNLTPEQLQEKFAVYTGKEYQEYLDSKK